MLKEILNGHPLKKLPEATAAAVPEDQAPAPAAAEDASRLTQPPLTESAEPPLTMDRITVLLGGKRREQQNKLRKLSEVQKIREGLLHQAAAIMKQISECDQQTADILNSFDA